jgi:N-acyl-D-aspartate/D-glutamate deacylase
MASAYDTVIRGGTVADGKSDNTYEADVAIKDGRIVEVGKVSGSGTEEIDAKGKLVTPGFVDLHTHYDGQVIWSSRLAPSSGHGVTTVVTGNCGVGFAPCRNQDHDLLVRVMEGVEDIPEIVMTEGLKWEWETFPEYLDTVAKIPHDIDTAHYLPHSPLRVYVMGQRAANLEVATEADLAQLKNLTKEAVQAGAMGFATSRSQAHRTRDGEPIPSFDVADAEFRAIAEGLREAGKGIFQLATDQGRRGFALEVEWLHKLTRESGRPATFSFGNGNKKSDDWRNVLDMVDKANNEGAKISPQIYPRPVSIIMGWNLSINPFCLLETYQPLLKLSPADRVKELRRPEVREKLLVEKPADPKNKMALLGRMWDYMFVLPEEAPTYEPAPESSIGAQAKARGVSPESVAYDLLMEKNGQGNLAVWMGNYQDGSLDSIHEMLGRDNVILGLGDGGAHYGMICDASYPTHVLAYWTRDRKGKRLSVGRAVKALASDPCRFIGFLDRGVLARGYKADINVIDYDKLTLFGPEIKYDLPSAGRRLNQRAKGFDITMVSGKIAHRNDQHTNELPGRLVRGAQPAPK